MKQPYVVVIQQVTNHTFYVEDCNSPEEAEGLAEGFFSDGDEGSVEVIDSEVIDCYPEDHESD